MASKENPIRVAQMMTEMNYGGVEMAIMNYYRHIDRSRIQFDFFVLQGSSIPQKEEIESMGGRIFIVPKYTHLIQYEREIQYLLKKNQYKIVHSHMNTLSVFSLYGAKKAGIGIRIAHNHSTAGKGEMKKNIIKYFLRLFSKCYATDLCACSNWAGYWLFGKNKPFKVFNNAIDLEKYRYNEETRNKLRIRLGINGKKVIGHIGRFCYQKNHALLVDIFNEVLKKEKNAVLLLIGEGDLEADVKHKVRKLEIEDKVLFLGHRTNAFEFYQVMDCFVFPSRYEGLGMVAIEAQAMGLPVICSTNVPQEAKILDTTVFVDTIDQYVKAVIDGLKIGRREAEDKIRKAGYDIRIEAQKLSVYYEELLAKNE